MSHLTGTLYCIIYCFLRFHFHGQLYILCVCYFIGFAYAKVFFTHLHCSMPNNNDALTCWISAECIFVKLYHQQSRKGHLIFIGIYSPTPYSICVSKRITEPVGGMRRRFRIRLLPLSLSVVQVTFYQSSLRAWQLVYLAPCRNL